jgi:hypothetical protein
MLLSMLAEDLPSRLLGRWYGRVMNEPVGMEFRADGRLAYVIQSKGKRTVMLLTWRLDGEDLVTDQPSKPAEERTKVAFEGDDLILTFEGVPARFSR